MKTCEEILDMYNFEYRLLKVYTMFLKPLADVFTCVQTAEGRQLTHPVKLPELDSQQVKDMGNQYDMCYYKIKPTNKDCMKICDKNPLKFELQLNLRNLYAKALEFYFPVLVKQSIRKYYLEVKKEQFRENDEDEIRFFDVRKMKKLEFKLLYSEDGVNVFGNEMSKKYE